MVASDSAPVSSSPAPYHSFSDQHDERLPGSGSYSHEEKEAAISNSSFSSVSLVSSAPALPAAPSDFHSEYESKYGTEHKHDDWAAKQHDNIKHQQLLLHNHNNDSNNHILVTNPSNTSHDPSTTAQPAHSALSVESSPDEEQAPPFPWMKVVLIASINLNDAFQMNVLWPMVPQMIRDFQFPESQNGLYCGLLASSYFLAQLLSSFPWGVVSDRLGRRPVLLYGTFAVTAATLVFGLSSSFGVAFASRFLAGFLSGNLGTSKTYLSEELHTKHLARGLSAIGFAGGIGGIIGPVVGGYLNRPAIQYPGVFSEDGLFGQFPYLLPELVSVAIGLVGFILAIKYLPESDAYIARQRALAEAKQQQNESAVRYIQDHAHDSELPSSIASSRQLSASSSLQANVSRPALPPNLSPESIRSVCKRRQVLVCCITYGMLALTFIIYDELFSFFFEADTAEQGLGYSSARTGTYLGVMGISLIAVQILIFPWLVDRVGVMRLWKVSTALAIPFFVLFPLLSNLESLDLHEYVMFGIISTCCFIRAAIGACSFTPIFMLINGSAPQSSLGAVNGLGQTLAAAARTVGPLIGGGVWSGTIDWGSSHHFVVYAIVGVLCAVTYWVGSKAEERIVYVEEGAAGQTGKSELVKGRRAHVAMFE